jgi:protein O-mannosyl-transferase
MARRAKQKKADARSIAPSITPSIAPVSGRERWIARAIVAAFSIAAFGRAMLQPLLDGWDDDRFVSNDPLVLSPSVAGLASIFGEPHFEAYHPLHLLSYWIDVPWAGANGPVIHAVSLALWILALFALLEACFALGLGFFGGLSAALIVGVHPVQVEAIAWAAGRKEVLALGFSALSIWMHARSTGPWDARAWASRAAYLAACLSKTTAIPLPILLIAADLLALNRHWKRSIFQQTISFVFAIVLGLFTVTIWQANAMLRPLEGTERIGLAAATLTHHLKTAIWPAEVSPLYPIYRGGSIPVASWLLGPAAIVTLLAAAWRLRSGKLAFGIVAFVVLLAPALNVLPLYWVWQDRYLSLPLFGLAFAAGAGVDRLGARAPRWAPAVLAGALAVALATLSAIYTGAWRDRLTLFGHAASEHPEEFYAWLNLGHARRDRGRLYAALDAYERAIAAQNLALGHDARFDTILRLDESQRGLTPSRRTELLGRFHGAVSDADAMRALASRMAEAGYRRAVFAALDHSFALDPIDDDTLERAALIQLQRRHAWLADYYVSRMSRPPRTPDLAARAARRH